jgi:hypothetical protein
MTWIATNPSLRWRAGTVDNRDLIASYGQADSMAAMKVSDPQSSLLALS